MEKFGQITELLNKKLVMRSEIEINERINDILKNVHILLKKRDEEMGKPFGERDNRLLLFIQRECSIYDYSLSQLRWMLSE
jgi:hypothetical protein